MATISARSSLELDEAGDVISYEEYFPFGGTSFIAGRSARDIKLKEYRYSGKLRDDATGFYCYEYRYYAPFIGGWLSPDPLGPVDGLNLYRFVHNNPIRFVDADGLQTVEDVVWRTVGPAPGGLSTEQAIAYFNRRYAIREKVRATDARWVPSENEWQVQGVPLDPRLLTYAQKHGITDLEFAEIGFSLQEEDKEDIDTQTQGADGEDGTLGESEKKTEGQEGEEKGVGPGEGKKKLRAKAEKAREKELVLERTSKRPRAVVRGQNRKPVMESRAGVKAVLEKVRPLYPASRSVRMPLPLHQLWNCLRSRLRRVRPSPTPAKSASPQPAQMPVAYRPPMETVAFVPAVQKVLRRRACLG